MKLFERKTCNNYGVSLTRLYTLQRKNKMNYYHLQQQIRKSKVSLYNMDIKPRSQSLERGGRGVWIYPYVKPSGSKFLITTIVDKMVICHPNAVLKVLCCTSWVYGNNIETGEGRNGGVIMISLQYRNWTQICSVAPAISVNDCRLH